MKYMGTMRRYQLTLGLWLRWWKYRLAREVHDPLHEWIGREGPRLVNETMRRPRRDDEW